MFVAELYKDIQAVIPDIVDWVRNPNQEVSESVLELFSKLVAYCGYCYWCLIDVPK